MVSPRSQLPMLQQLDAWTLHRIKATFGDREPSKNRKSATNRSLSPRLKGLSTTGSMFLHETCYSNS